jgi:tetraacyldisaccharide 4'-kinase
LNYEEVRRKVSGKEGLFSLLFPAFWIASKIFCAVSFIRGKLYEMSVLKRHEFKLPVISVGNLVVGGAGKTSISESIYEELKSTGFSPCIVMRGYKGREKGPVFAEKDPERFGDEASLYAQKGIKVVVSRDRVKGIDFAFSNGANICILDDGFQHLRVKPLVNILLVDLFNPFGHGECIPLGTLREPLSSLERADCFVLTRANLVSSERVKSVEAYLRSFNKPIFHARQEFKYWVNQDYKRVEQPDGGVTLFCGIGNPDQFIEMLLNLGLVIENVFIFNDHHEYSERDIERLSKFENLVTTEKDMIKLKNFDLEVKVPLLRFEVYGLKEFVINRIKNVERQKELSVEGSFLPGGISSFKAFEQRADTFKQG